MNYVFSQGGKTANVKRLIIGEKYLLAYDKPFLLRKEQDDSFCVGF